MKHFHRFMLMLLIAALFLTGCAHTNQHEWSDAEQARLSEYGITLTRTQQQAVDAEGFLHDMDCFFGDVKDSEPYAKRVENAACERYEGTGYAVQRWIGGEFTLEEMWIGDEKVYERELSFPMTEEIAAPE